MLRSFYQKHRRKIDRVDQFLLGNPILERGLVLAPIVVTCTSISNALVLSGAFAIITILTILITYFIPKKLPYTIRVILSAAVAACIFVPLSFWLRERMPEAVFSLGVYLPLLATNSLVVQKSESRYHHERLPVMAAQLFTASLGFSATALATAFVRELFGKGTLFGQPVEWVTRTAPALLMPFGGFILLGFFAALLQKFRLYLEKQPRKKGRKEDRHA